MDIRGNFERQPLNVFNPQTNREATVGRPDTKPDDVILGWLLPFNNCTVEVNGLNFRGAPRFENWRRSLLPYELRWCSALLSISDCLLVLKYVRKPVGCVLYSCVLCDALVGVVRS